MQALGSLAGAYATCEEAWANLENENSEGDPLCADARAVMDELAKAQQHQGRCQDEVKCSRESTSSPRKNSDNEAHNAVAYAVPALS